MAESNGQEPIPSGVGKLEAAKQATQVCVVGRMEGWPLPCSRGTFGLAPDCLASKVEVGMVPMSSISALKGLSGCAWDSSEWTVRLPETGLSGCA